MSRRKILSLALAVVMILAFSTGAVAVDEKNEIGTVLDDTWHLSVSDLTDEEINEFDFGVVYEISGSWHYEQQEEQNGITAATAHECNYIFSHNSYEYQKISDSEHFKTTKENLKCSYTGCLSTAWRIVSAERSPHVPSTISTKDYGATSTNCPYTRTTTTLSCPCGHNVSTSTTNPSPIRAHTWTTINNIKCCSSCGYGMARSPERPDEVADTTADNGIEWSTILTDKDDIISALLEMETNNTSYTNYFFEHEAYLLAIDELGIELATMTEHNHSSECNHAEVSSASVVSESSSAVCSHSVLVLRETQKYTTYTSTSHLFWEVKYYDCADSSCWYSTSITTQYASMGHAWTTINGIQCCILCGYGMAR